MAAGPTRNDSGIVTAFVVIFAVALVFVAGLVLDGGRMLAEHRQAGNLADSAARAGRPGHRRRARAGGRGADPRHGRRRGGRLRLRVRRRLHVRRRGASGNRVDVTRHGLDRPAAACPARRRRCRPTAARASPSASRTPPADERRRGGSRAVRRPGLRGRTGRCRAASGGPCSPRRGGRTTGRRCRRAARRRARRPGPTPRQNTAWSGSSGRSSPPPSDAAGAYSSGTVTLSVWDAPAPGASSRALVPYCCTPSRSSGTGNRRRETSATPSPPPRPESSPPVT